MTDGELDWQDLAMIDKTTIRRWGKFLVGLLGLSLAVMFFGSGYTPPGICGEVIRHNQRHNIDASPFFYGDVENMLELIESAEQLYRGSGLNEKVEGVRP
jgi:hypothetical protein